MQIQLKTLPSNSVRGLLTKYDMLLNRRIIRLSPIEAMNLTNTLSDSVFASEPQNIRTEFMRRIEKNQ